MPSGLFNAGSQVGFRMAAAEPGAGKLPGVVVGQAVIVDVFSALKACAVKGVIFLAIEAGLGLEEGATEVGPPPPPRGKPNPKGQAAPNPGVVGLPKRAEIA